MMAAALVLLPLLAAVPAVYAGDDGGFRAWAAQVRQLDCSRAREPSECVDRGGQVQGGMQALASSTTALCKRGPEAEAFLIAEAAGGRIPAGAVEFLRFCGRRPRELVTSVARQALRTPSLAATEILVFFVEGATEPSDWLWPLLESTGTERAATARRLARAALTRPTLLVRAAPLALRIDPMLLEGQSLELVLPLVLRRAGETGTEKMALVNLLARVVGGEPRPRAAVEDAIRGDRALANAWLCACLADSDRRGRSADEASARQWIALAGSGDPEGRKKWMGCLGSSGRKRVYKATFEQKARPDDKDPFWEGLRWLAWQPGEADVMKSGLYYVTPKATWADWFLSLVPTTCAQHAVRLELFLATDADLGPAFVRLQPSQACPDYRERLVREFFNSVEHWKHIKERTQPADWLAKNGHLLDGEAINLLLFFAFGGANERSQDWGAGVLAQLGKLSDKQFIVHLSGFPTHARSLSVGVGEVMWASVASQCQARRRPGALVACAMYNGAGRLPGVDRVVAGLRATEALAPGSPEWTEAVGVLRDELLRPGGRSRYNDDDCVWLGQAITRLGKSTVGTVALEGDLRARLKCDDPAGRAALHFTWE